jgi:tRNA-dihydrouridine synthase B
MLNETGCAGVSIGRGAFYNPWIFRDTRHYLRTGELRPEAGYAERVTVMRRHLDLMIEFYGEDFGCRLFRKPAAWYAKRFGPAKEFKKGITQFATRAEFEALPGGLREVARPLPRRPRRVAGPLPARPHGRHLHARSG